MAPYPDPIFVVRAHRLVALGEKWSSSRGHVSLNSFTSQAQGAPPHVGTLWLRATTGPVDPFDWLSRFLRVNSHPGFVEVT